MIEDIVISVLVVLIAIIGTRFMFRDNPLIKVFIEWLIKIVYKPKIPRHFITKKREKKHYPPYDDTYAKNMINDLLNDDCLALIFSYIPPCERPKIALVCKKWNTALCYSWSSLKKLKFSYWKTLNTQHLLNENPTTDGGLGYLISLFDKCGTYLTKLDLSAYDSSDIMPFINKSCPNVVIMRLRFIYIDNHHFKNAFSHLSKLKTLSIIFECPFKRIEKPQALHLSYEDVSDTLTELSLSYWSSNLHSLGMPVSSAVIISQLKALKKFELFGFDIECNKYHDIFEKAAIKFYNYSYETICFEKNFDKLSKVDIGENSFTDDSLYSLANLAINIKTLIGSSTLVTDAGIESITKMKYLTQLSIPSGKIMNLITDSQIKSLKNLQLLHLPPSNKITNDSVIKIVENSPGLQALSIRNTGVTFECINKIADITKKHKQYLLISVSFDPNICKEYKLLNLETSSIPAWKYIYVRYT